MYGHTGNHTCRGVHVHGVVAAEGCAVLCRAAGVRPLHVVGEGALFIGPVWVSWC